MSRRRHPNPARVIQRTTSETMRINGEPIAQLTGVGTHGQRPSNLMSVRQHAHTHQYAHYHARKQTGNSSTSSASFVVTGVSTLLEPESPDESPEEYSRQTDVETPSFSEDTSYSQYTEDIDYCGCEEFILNRCVNAVISRTEELIAPKAVTQTFNNVCSKRSSPMQIIATATPTSSADTHLPSPARFIGRFQVVKVESIHPFRRGRWKCHDYVDNSEYAPRDGYEFYQGRFIRRKELETLKKKLNDDTFIFEAIDEDMDSVTIIHNSTTPLVFMNAPVLSSVYHPILQSSSRNMLIPSKLKYI